MSLYFLCIATNTKKDFGPLLSILAHSNDKLPHEAVKAPTDDTIRQLYDSYKTTLSELRTELNNLNLFMASSAFNQVPGIPALSKLKDYRDRAAVSLVSIMFLLNALRRSKHQLMAADSIDNSKKVLTMMTMLNENLADLAHHQDENFNEEKLLSTLADYLDKYLKAFSPIARELIG